MHVLLSCIVGCAFLTSHGVIDCSRWYLWWFFNGFAVILW